MRQYQAVADLPPGRQIQVDFGQKRVRNSSGGYTTLYVMGTVLAHSSLSWSKTSSLGTPPKYSKLAAHARERIFDKPLRKEATSKRAAVEGSISSIKRSQGTGKLRVRTQPKVQVVTGFKVIGHNFRQLVRFFQGKVRKHVSVTAPPATGEVCTF